MKVLVNGASGFVGSHAIRALLDGDHEVRASARSADRVRRALEPLGCADSVEMVEGDVTDEDDVAVTLGGCEAVVNAAAVYSYDARRGKELVRGNVRGTENVIGTAAALGLDPIVHISSYVALLPSSSTVTAESPPGRPPTPYALSKARAEEVARGFQADGASVTIIHPGMVWGPDDPVVGESSLFARSVLDGKLPFGLPGTVPVVDVRDVAAVIAAVVRPGRGPRRYLAAGETVPMKTVQTMVAEAGGTRPPRGTAPGWLILGLGRVADWAQRVVPARLPINYQAPWTLMNGAPVDASATERELAVTFRPAEESIHDTTHWLLNDRRV
ncbi:MAG: NAD-dependent epimerase/dehydratase family protein [Actinomycetia bacterium]|nr:NAD-dependent epimerase/dehydratase family protein [Actinomycetes bacterium]